MFTVPEKNRVTSGIMGSTSREGNNGYFFLKRIKYVIRVICSQAEGWEHVSVSRSDIKMPTWKDMCYVKNKFWDKEDCVVQYHPPESEYINNHDFCLHLWRPIGQEYPMPPSIFVGLKGVTSDDIKGILHR